jgi:pimeloyl-ACP methyl ester carboxylesterase
MPINWPNIKPAIAAGSPEVISNNGLRALKLRFFVPLMHTDDTNSEVIELHAHFVYGPDHPPLFDDIPEQDTNQLLVSMLPPYNPYSIAVYLCGGPGDGNPAFANQVLSKTLLQNNHGVLYVDYRGTGQSSPITAESLSKATADAPSQSVAQYLALFRQDYIVADLEAIRLCLNSPKFSLVGQSFGGWIAMTYLSFLPNSLATVFLTGGLPPIGRSPEEVYTALYRQLVRANEEYYARYPEDKVKVLGVTMWLSVMNKRKAMLLPDGQRLTPRSFLTLGRHFGRGPEGYQHVHRMVHLFITDMVKTRSISDDTLREFAECGGTGFRLPGRPLYAVVHEAIYCSGVGLSSNWAAQRVGRQLPGPEGKCFEWLKDDFSFSFPEPQNHEPLYFSGEMIYEFMLRDAGPELEPFIEPANILAKSKGWSDLYDEEQLRRNDVFLRALVYPEDMFLDFDFSLETAGMVRRSCVARAPRDWTHGSIRTRPQEVCRLLFSAVRTEGLDEGLNGSGMDAKAE